LSAQEEVLDNFDLLSHVLGCIDDPNVEVMGRAAASWCVLNKYHNALLLEEEPWRLLVGRASARILPLNDSFWAKRVCDLPTDDTFFELCCLARLQRTGVARSMVRTAFKVFLNSDAQERWRRVRDAYGGGAIILDVNRKFTWIVDAWERMDPLEKSVYHLQVSNNFMALGFEGYSTLPGVRKLDG
jgi:hypothetical protein